THLRPERHEERVGCSSGHGLRQHDREHTSRALHGCVRLATPMLEPGLEAAVEERVTDELSAVALGSGDVAVLGTPAVLALAERAACAAIAGRLGEGETSVGTWVELSHLAPTPVGGSVTARARLVDVEGPK